MSHRSTPLPKVVILGANGMVGYRLLKTMLEQGWMNRVELHATARRREWLAEKAPLFPNIQFHYLELDKSENIEKLLQNKTVVLNCAGPFNRFGNKIVEACIESGVHYLDITGEVQWIRELIHRYQKRAIANHSLIVPGCGFDSVPTDTLVRQLLLEFQRRYQLAPEKIDLVYKIRGSANGGTIATAFDMAQQMTYSEIMNKDYLTASTDGAHQTHNMEARWIPQIQQWAAPFFMELINTKVARRSIHTDPQLHFARETEISESILITGTKIEAQTQAFLLRASIRTLQKPTIARVLKRFVPQPGQGPTDATAKRGHFQVQGYATRGEQLVTMKLECDGDPGNYATVRLMLACLELALNATQGAKGILSPSLAWGDGLYEALKNTDGVKIAIV